MESCGFPGLKGDTFGVRFCGGRAGADWLSWYPTLATKTNTWQGWGTRFFVGNEQWQVCCCGFPPLRQEKVARMGHGAFVGRPARTVGFCGIQPLPQKTKTWQGWGTRSFVDGLSLESKTPSRVGWGLWKSETEKT
jgi:hypothetical protein